MTSVFSLAASIPPVQGAAAEAFNAMLGRIQPEIALFITTCIVMVMGLSRTLAARQFTSWVAAIGLVLAGFLALMSSPEAAGTLMPHWLAFSKATVAVVGLLLLLLAAGTVDRSEEAAIAAGQPFNPLRTNRAEFYAFFLFSLTGVMLCASASDLIWLFLALELVSLPTYIMVVMSRVGRPGAKSQEAGVKYFFLGALGAATFLYGFALLYGGTGTTSLTGIAQALAAQSAAGGINSIALTGLLLSLIGISFKIAAVPMHFYTADVYEGAASPVSAFLAFAPKTAGFLAIILLCACAGWTHGPSGGSLPEVVRVLLWVVAAMTMTVGNVLAVMQTSVKRMLAYSSIAHSGYMLVGVIAGPGKGESSSGISAVLLYLLAYGLMNAGCFAVLACLERKPLTSRNDHAEEPQEIERVEDLRGLRQRHPALAWTMAICALGLMGFPPLMGFWTKLPLFTAAVGAGELILVIILGINSAIAAYYYLRLVALPILEKPGDAPAASPTPFASRNLAALASAGAVIGLVFLANMLMGASQRAARPADLAALKAPAVPVEPFKADDHSHAAR